MKRIGLVLLAALVVVGCNDNTKDDGWRVGYSLGYKFGERFGKEIKDLNMKGFMAGFEDGYAGKGEDGKPKVEAKLTEEEMEAAIKAYQEKRVTEMREEMKQKSEKNSADAKAFLDKNAQNPNVKTLPSGLQYEIITQGTGPSPKATDIVKAKYHGTLIDGTVFDSTRERGDQPAEFPLNRVIPAWTEGVQLMNRGAKFKLYVPPALGYGERGAGGKIGPNQALVFEIELVDFNAADEAPGAPKKK